MKALANVLASLDRRASEPVLRHGARVATGAEVRSRVAAARAGLLGLGLDPGARVVLLGPNSIDWIAIDLAIAAAGGVAVPLYHRQAPEEWRGMIADCGPSLVLCADAELRAALGPVDGARVAEFAEVLGGEAATAPRVVVEPRADDAPLRLFYTSGTSGAPKGVILTPGNVAFMLPRTSQRLDLLMDGADGRERIFHYLPFCFAGSWILLWTALSRGSFLRLATSLETLADELREHEPHTVLNVPLLLERMRAAVTAAVEARGAIVRWIWRTRPLARALLHPAIRRRFGRNLRAMIAGSAPLSASTQQWFADLGIEVLQVYGLTETTAICTMDVPGRPRPGRVGPAVDGIAMRVNEHGEIETKGPHLFPGYWGKPPREGEWYATGDLGDVDAEGRWRILGRRKDLLVLSSGHNVNPEPIEERLAGSLGAAAQVVLFGHGRPFVTALVAGERDRTRVGEACEAVNGTLAHFERVRDFLVHEEPLTADDGLLTANGKLKRGAIAERFADELEALYA